jgi:hypothetical protein
MANYTDKLEVLKGYCLSNRTRLDPFAIIQPQLNKIKRP